MRGVPQWWIRLLHWTQFHWDIVVLVVDALERQPFLRHPSDENRQRLVKHLARTRRIYAEVA